MSPKQSVLLLGATGETGRSILDGLLEDGSFDIKLLIRKASLDKPAVHDLRSQGLETVIGDPDDGIEALVSLMQGIHTVISTISAASQTAQLPMVEAAKRADVKRFVPCAWISVCAPGGIMKIRDEKEKVYQQIWKAHLPYTIIDIGFWHQISFPKVPSGCFDYAIVTPYSNTIIGDSDAPTLLTHRRDVGRFTARIIKDERTLNKFVYTCSDLLSQNDIFALVEDVTGERVERNHMTGDELLSSTAAGFERLDKDPTDFPARIMAYMGQYNYSKSIRRDNTPDNAKYLGYLDARELYPDFKPISFRSFLDELLEGKARKPYPHVESWDI